MGATALAMTSKAFKRAQPGSRPSTGKRIRGGDELGAHVSAAGGVVTAPARAWALDARVLQLFTKQPNRWAEPAVTDADAAAFIGARRRHRIRIAGSHDSYLINLASPDSQLFARSCVSFRAELQRCSVLGLDFLVTHPGHAMDGDMARGLAQNAAAIEQALAEIPGNVRVLLETTPGAVRSVGATFEQLAALLERIAAPHRARMGVCIDTCHIWVAGYDVRRDYEGVFSHFADTVGLERIGLFHLNDSGAPHNSRHDRHAHIGQGTLGYAFFRRLLRDERFHKIPKIIETPKADSAERWDRRNLRVLRSYRDGSRNK
jgi:deoxyribonuclease-4